MSYSLLMRKPRIIYDLASILARGTSKPFGAVIELTKDCNLRCKHCYFFRQDYETELSDSEWLTKLKNARDEHGLLLGSWCGGEPLLRETVIAEGMKHFRYNQVLTNGTLPLPNWPEAVFEVSVDGTKEFHELTRGRGTYDRIKRNINRSGLRINLACIINKLNYKSLSDMVEEWSKTHVRGIHFGFYSPTRTEQCDDLTIDFKLRDTIIDRIRTLKREYGDFILAPEKVLDLMSSGNTEEVTSNCLYDKLFVTFGPDGKEKRCPVGDQAVCSQCGHSPPYFMQALRTMDFEALKLVFNQLS